MIDSHTHLDVCEPPNEELVAAAREAGVVRMLTVGMDEQSNRGAIAAAEAFDEVFCAIGRHPNSADGFDDAALEDLRALAAHPKVAAIGETGLDYFREHADPADQARAFSAQIVLAREVGKPVVIHARAADDDVVATLAREAEGVEVVMHCFSMPDRLDDCLERGWWISFAGNVTYPKNRDLAFAAERVPDDRLLVETDAPFLTPQAVRKHRNQPAFVAHTAAFVAERRGTSVEGLSALVEQNAARLYRW